MKKKYVLPSIHVSFIELEQSIATESTPPTTPDTPSNVEHQWEDQVEDERDFEW